MFFFLLNVSVLIYHLIKLFQNKIFEKNIYIFNKA